MKHNMGDEGTIREIIAEVDTDRVSYTYLWTKNTKSWYLLTTICFSLFAKSLLLCKYWMLNLFVSLYRMDESTMMSFLRWWGKGHREPIGKEINPHEWLIFFVVLRRVLCHIFFYNIVIILLMPSMNCKIFFPSPLIYRVIESLLGHSIFPWN